MAFLDETGLTRLWGKIEGKFSQFSGNIENTINAIENTYTKPYTEGNLNVYLSKNGSDSNDGLTSETPILTLDKALEIANKSLPSNANSYLNLYFGPGNWGDITFTYKPYCIRIMPYNGQNYTSYSNDIPVFDGINAQFGAFIFLMSSVCGYINAHEGSYVYISPGVHRIGYFVARYRSSIHIEGGTDDSNTIEIPGGTLGSVFLIYQGGRVTFTGSRKIKIIGNITVSTAFTQIVTGGEFNRAQCALITLDNNVIVTGCRCTVGITSRLGDSVTDTTFPGTVNVNYADGAIINGVTVGNTTHPGNKTFTDSITINGDHGAIENTAIILSGARQNFGIALQATNATKGTAPSAQINSGIEFYGSVRTKYQNRYGLLENTISTANLNTMKIVAYNPSSAENTGNCTISVNVDGSGNAYTYAPTPAVADSSTKIATTAWVRTATGNIAANAATATKVGTATVGSGTKPIYLNAGAPTAFTATVGGTAKPVYLNAGTLTAITATVGSTARPVYLNAGTITVGLTHFTACSATAAGTAGPVTAPTKGKQAQFLRGDATWAAPSTSSDRRVKQDFSTIPDDVLDAWENINYKRFKLKEEVNEKGQDALYHTGLVVQDIQEVFEQKNLDANKYDMIIHEVWPAHDNEYDEEGNLISPKDDGYEQYFMHYEEALSIEAAYLRKQVKLLKEKVDNLEKQISTISSKIS